jgi:hypothetical protein
VRRERATRSRPSRTIGACDATRREPCSIPHRARALRHGHLAAAVSRASRYAASRPVSACTCGSSKATRCRVASTDCSVIEGDRRINMMAGIEVPAVRYTWLGLRRGGSKRLAVMGLAVTLGGLLNTSDSPRNPVHCVSAYGLTSPFVPDQSRVRSIHSEITCATCASSPVYM